MSRSPGFFRRLAVAALALGTLTPQLAHAIEDVPVVQSNEAQDSLKEHVLGSVASTRWRNAPQRWFAAGRVDLGFFFFRPRFSAGYGQPHYRWIGLDLVPLISPSAGGSYAGVRLEESWLELRTGLLYQYSFNRSLLEARESYDKRDIDLITAERAQYLLWDSEIELNVTLGKFSFLSETQPIYTGNLPDGRYVYLDSLAVVAASGWTLRQRVGLEWFLPNTYLGVAPMAEALWLDERSTVIVRAGVQLRLVLSEEVQVRTTLLPVVTSPDHLGRAGGDVLEISVRYLWATE